MDPHEQFAQYPLALREQAYQSVRAKIGPGAPMKINDLLKEVEAINMQDIEVIAMGDDQLYADREMQRLDAEIVENHTRSPKLSNFGGVIRTKLPAIT